MKIILLLFLHFMFLFSTEIGFKETRYMVALDFERVKHGSLFVKEENLIIKYTKPSVETISYLSDRITILKDEETLEYTFEEYPKSQYMGLILKAIIKDEYSTLDEMFEVKKENNIVKLLGKPIVYSIIESISIEKSDNLNKKIIINMTNKDIVTIETIN
ncbi:MAG: hypothetical protein U9R16_04360 [Campylobacterota bacterium]|nr:hypothetical protein [Campylobacterota bacterium]